MKQLAKGILNYLWSLKPKRTSNRIMYYHSILDTGKRSHKRSAFYDQMKWLKQHGYTSIPLSELPEILAGKRAVQEPWVAITFDDGYKDNVDIALPILREFGFVATFFIVTSWLDSNGDRYRGYTDVERINSEGVLELANSGMEIGSHTHTHRMCTKVWEESELDFVNEIRFSKLTLEGIVGAEVDTFSYPNGQRGAFSENTKAVLLDNKYSIACTTLWGSIDQRSDLLALPRCEVSHLDTIEDFAAKMLGRRDYLYYIHRNRDQSKVWFKDQGKGN